MSFEWIVFAFVLCCFAVAMIVVVVIIWLPNQCPFHHSFHYYEMHMEAMLWSIAFHMRIILRFSFDWKVVVFPIRLWYVGTMRHEQKKKKPNPRLCTICCPIIFFPPVFPVFATHFCLTISFAFDAMMVKRNNEMFRHIFISVCDLFLCLSCYSYYHSVFDAPLFWWWFESIYLDYWIYPIGTNDDIMYDGWVSGCLTVYHMRHSIQTPPMPFRSLSYADLFSLHNIKRICQNKMHSAPQPDEHTRISEQYARYFKKIFSKR